MYAEKEELVNLLNQIKEEQIKVNKLTNIRTRILNNDTELLQYYQIVNEIIFTKPNTRDNRWKLYVPKRMEPQIITTYHQVYGHMGPTKVIKALEEHAYIKGINKKVRLILRKCGLCQRVKVNNEKKEGALITITSERKLEKVFLHICGPFPRSGGRHRHKYIVIIWDHFTKYTKLYPISKVSTRVIVNLVINKYIPDVGSQNK